MYKSCSKCGRIHNTNYKCKAYNKYKVNYDYEESKLRNTHEWHTKADQIKNDSNYLCSVCFEEGIYNYNELETHHIEKLKERPDLLLEDTNLICLCRTHHKLADKQMIDKDYLKQLAKKRIEEIKV